mgnify:CR=1 FL=1|jgi:hypothetical protein
MISKRFYTINKNQFSLADSIPMLPTPDSRTGRLERVIIDYSIGIRKDESNAGENVTHGLSARGHNKKGHRIILRSFL